MSASAGRSNDQQLAALADDLYFRVRYAAHPAFFAVGFPVLRVLPRVPTATIPGG
jgi:hypothetical protein